MLMPARLAPAAFAERDFGRARRKGGRDVLQVNQTTLPASCAGFQSESFAEPSCRAMCLQSGIIHFILYLIAPLIRTGGALATSSKGASYEASDRWSPAEGDPAEGVRPRIERECPWPPWDDVPRRAGSDRGPPDRGSVCGVLR
jgi:hypothetical protein